MLGVGGNVSQGILKALELVEPRPTVVAACIDPLAPGLYLADHAYVSPRADDARFLPWLLDVVRERDVDAILSGVEPVLEELAGAAAEIARETGAKAIVSEPRVLAIGADKQLTAEWLRERGLNAPDSAPASDAAAVEALVRAHGFPLIAKPRAGKGAQGVLTVDGAAALAYAQSLSGHVIQQLLGQASEEYTVGCFCDRDGVVQGAMTMRRELASGTTVRARAVDAPAVRDQAVAIVEALQPTGPCNVQLRMHEGEPVAFELNIRFSGTTPARARLGFNEVATALEHLVRGRPSAAMPEVTDGLVLRYWNEVYVDPASADELAATKRLDRPADARAEVEDWGSG